MKAFNIFFILLFLFSAGLQYNDPDPYVWMPIYLYGAVLCCFAIQRKYFPMLYLAGFLFYGAYALFLIFDRDGVFSWINMHGAESIVQTMKADKSWIEETREFFGLAILMAVLAVNRMWLRRSL